MSSTGAAVTNAQADEATSASHISSVPRPTRAVAEWVAAVVGFTSLSVVLTWPWAKEMWNGSVGGDAAQFVWDAWWVQERVFDLRNPWWTSDLYAPEGTYLAAHPLETLVMVLVSPVTALAGPMVTYGLLVIATLAAAGVLAWRLGLAMGLGTVGSWVSRALWASSPIVVHRTASGLYMLLLLAALLPAALILALRLMHGFSVRRAVVLGVFLGACLLTDLQVTAYILLAVGAVGLYAVTTKPVWRSRAALKRLAAVTAAFLVGGIPALAMVARAEAGQLPNADWRTGGVGQRSRRPRAASATGPASRLFADTYERAAEELGSLSSSRSTARSLSAGRRLALSSAWWQHDARGAPGGWRARSSSARSWPSGQVSRPSGVFTRRWRSTSARRSRWSHRRPGS